MSDAFVKVRLSDKVRWSLPWLLRYPFWRAAEISRRLDSRAPQHVVFIVANHFEPGLGYTALQRLEKWCKLARATGEAVRDHDGTPFRHTNFFPAEQYERPIVDMMADLQRDGFGEVEVHLHHGVDQPDTSANTRAILEQFRDVLAYEHGCLSREDPNALPKYAFVHGNWALANSAGGRFCGVDDEMQILADTGCYGDFTLPSVPFQSQVARINAIYHCGHDRTKATPHRSGPGVKVGDALSLPLIVTGPLVFDWSRRVRNVPVPRIDDGALAVNYRLGLDRFRRWKSANIGVKGKPGWVFIKLFSHAFFEADQDAMMGEQMKRFMGDVLDEAERKNFRVHFATAREAFNMIAAAVDGRTGEPHEYRDYKLRQIMSDRPQVVLADRREEQLILAG
jgi:hypothetical protein